MTSFVADNVNLHLLVGTLPPFTIHHSDLLKNFFASAGKVLKRPHGEVHVVLRAGQGGVTATSFEDWKQTWMAPYYAAQNNLLLRRLEDYKV